MDLREATILLAIEPHEGFELDDILDTADDAAAHDPLALTAPVR